MPGALFSGMPSSPCSPVPRRTRNKIVSAWCADNPKIALTKAKAGKEIEQRTCDNPVAAQYELGGVMGVNSTPSLVFEDGTMNPGYVPAATLAVRLGIM